MKKIMHGVPLLEYLMRQILYELNGKVDIHVKVVTTNSSIETENIYFLLIFF